MSKKCSGVALQGSHGPRAQTCNRTCNNSWGLHPTWWQTAPLPSLPEGQPEIDEVPGPLTDIVSQAADLVPLYQDSGQFGNVPTEDEMVAHFVVPFLKGLGWPAELIGIK